MDAQPSHALITARAGSSRILRKNHLEVGGIPIWKRALLFAQRAGLMPIVDTDDEDILVQLDPAFCIPHRRTTPPEDKGGTHWEAIQAAMDDCGATAVLLLQPTSPLRQLRTYELALREWRAFDGDLPVVTSPGPVSHGSRIYVDDEGYKSMMRPLAYGMHIWDGNMAIFRNGTALTCTASVATSHNPRAYGLQLDWPADVQEAHALAEILPNGGLY